MKKIGYLLILGQCVYFSSMAQETLGAKIDELTYKWDDEAEKMKDYEGLAHFCLTESYRSDVIHLLNEIHHYDSVLYDRLIHADRFGNASHEVKKTLNEIAAFEAGYDMKSFIHFLHTECNARSDIERHSEELKAEVGEESYDGQIYILENELSKYVAHITKRVDHIREHVHHLHIK